MKEPKKMRKLYAGFVTFGAFALFILGACSYLTDGYMPDIAKPKEASNAKLTSVHLDWTVEEGFLGGGGALTILRQRMSGRLNISRCHRS